MQLTPFCLAAACVVIVCCVGGCTKKERPAAPVNARARRASVNSFEANAIDLPGEVAFLSSLEFEPTSERNLAGGAFDQLLGLDGARAHQATLMLGDQRLDIRQFSLPAGSSLEPARANDLGFEHLAIVVRDMDAAYTQLLELHARTVSASPQTLPASNPVAAGVRAEYFRDPEGHFLELIQFPRGKGDPAWHRDTRRLFLGIDHSAISVSRTADSLRFYRDALGLHVASDSINEGREQEELSGVPGARVHITSLRGEHGPGIELLEYLAPLGGAPFPDSTPADAIHWEIAIEVASLGASEAALRNAGFGAGSAHAASSALPGESRALLVRDPDGHSVRLFEDAAE